MAPIDKGIRDSQEACPAMANVTAADKPICPKCGGNGWYLVLHDRFGGPPGNSRIECDCDSLPQLTIKERAAMDALPPDFAAGLLAGKRWIDGKWFVPESALAAARAEGRADGVREAIAVVPTSWLHALLSGPDAVLSSKGAGHWGCPDIERLLSRVKERLLALLPKETSHE